MLDIKRRELIALIGGGSLLLAVKVKRAWGQQPTKIPRIANPDNASNMAALAETKIAASEAGTVLIPVEVRAVGDFAPAFAAIIRGRPDAVLVSNDLFHQLHIGRIIEFLAENPLPGMFQSK